MTAPVAFPQIGEQIGVRLPGARALFTTRRGGVSSGPYATLNLGLTIDGEPDDPDHVADNRARVLAATSARAVALGRQVHGTAIATATARGDGYRNGAEEADGQATARDDVAVAVHVADCLPIALAGEGAVAVLHGGWRGLADGIVAAGVAALRELGATPVAAAIGPGAGRCCYETGEEVHARFAGYGDDVRDGRNLDLKLIARRALERAGVAEVHDVGLCTICDERFFSHRRDGGVTGRQAGLVWRD